MIVIVQIDKSVYAFTLGIRKNPIIIEPSGLGGPAAEIDSFYRHLFWEIMSKNEINSTFMTAFHQVGDVKKCRGVTHGVFSLIFLRFYSPFGQDRGG